MSAGRSRDEGDQTDDQTLVHRLERRSPYDVRSYRNTTPETEPLSNAWIDGIEKRVAYIYDIKKQRLTANGIALAGLYGYTPEEISSMPEGWDTVVHPDDLERVRAGRESLLSGQTDSVSVQMRVACKDGRWEWIQHDWRALERDASGAMIRSIGLVQVITSLALSTQALRNEASLNALCRTLVEEWVDGIFLVDEDWHILFANQGALDALGYTQAELHGRSILHVISTETGRKKEFSLPKPCQKVTLRGSHILKDGGRQKVEIVLRRLPGERVLITTRDIREQLAAEEYTRRQAAYYRGLFENNPSGVAVFDTHLQITKVNSALRRMLGYTDKQLVQMRIPDLLDSVNRPADDFWKQIVEPQGKPQKDIEITLKRREGKNLYVHAAVTFLPDTVHESGQGIIIFTDISARRQAEQELKRQSQLNDTLVRESAAMIGMVDLEGRILKVNPAVEKISGYSAKELVGKTVWESGLVDPEEIPRAKERLKKLHEGAPRVTAISRGRTKSGDLRIIQVHNTTTRNADQQIEGFIITAIDITEQQRLQHHLMEAIEQEQARIGHDLHDGVGQLLTGIGSLVEMLQMRLKETTEQTEARRIHELVQQAIQQVRQLSRNMSPAAIQHRDLAASLHLLADTVVTQFRRECEFVSGLSVKIDDPTQSTHLFRIAQEAINNAIRHGNPQKILINLQQEDTGHAVLEVFNDGRAFDCQPGFEGIGLRVMNYRATLIHADFSVNCPPKGGVKVTCKFPLLNGEGSPQATPKNKQKYKP
ncbi:PAS domain S-box-containing protein [Prosthecobacter fusiformis]|uniref:PAS domain S-box-containing protein n=1 Tax=Prosthecobacter fusiformis TaxID=48464 RepID=A0A4R7S682_9BACT|nr:PAS domain S-box protein [Prosthecobacter fusiformis]TDU73176.1 PAS domain S-box-containing protein [Prosthecobacter fusiformis]